MHHLFRFLAFVAIVCLAVFAFWPVLAYAQSADSVVAPSSIWFEVWTIVQPIVVLLVSTVGPVLVAWIAARVIAVLKVTDEKQRLDIEAKLRDALHQSAMNALKFALAKAGVSALGQGASTNAVVAVAMGYVREKNPDTLRQLGVDTSVLRDIILSKVPDLIAPPIAKQP